MTELMGNLQTIVLTILWIVVIFMQVLQRMELKKIEEKLQKSTNVIQDVVCILHTHGLLKKVERNGLYVVHESYMGDKLNLIKIWELMDDTRSKLEGLYKHFGLERKYVPGTESSYKTVSIEEEEKQ